MGNLGDIMFGKTTEPSIQPYANLGTGQQALLDKLSTLLTGQIGTGVPEYSGSLTAGPSGLETKAWGGLEDLFKTTTAGGPNKTALDAINRIMGGTTSFPAATIAEPFDVQGYDVGEFDRSEIDKWYQDALVAPSLRTWEQDVIPTVQESFIEQGAGSSGAANRAISRSGEDLVTNLNAALANALFGEKQAYDTRKYSAGMDEINKIFQEATNRQNLGFAGTESAAGREFTAGQNDLQRLLQVPGLATGTENDFINNILNIAQRLGTAGATERGIEQGGLTRDYGEYLRTQPEANPWLDRIRDVLSVKETEPVVSGGTQQSGLLQDVISPLLGGLLGTEAGAGGLMKLLGLSDTAAKTAGGTEGGAAILEALGLGGGSPVVGTASGLLPTGAPGLTGMEASSMIGGEIGLTGMETPAMMTGTPGLLPSGVTGPGGTTLSTAKVPAALADVLGETGVVGGGGTAATAGAGSSGALSPGIATAGIAAAPIVGGAYTLARVLNAAMGNTDKGGTFRPWQPGELEAKMEWMNSDEYKKAIEERNVAHFLEFVEALLRGEDIDTGGDIADDPNMGNIDFGSAFGGIFS